jgi:hypothetical protein
MDMHHGRSLPAMAAAATGALLFGYYVAHFGLDADLGASPAALGTLIATFVVPGIAGIAVAAALAKSAKRVPVAHVVVAPPVEAFVAPIAPAEAVADIRSLTEVAAERRMRDRRADDRRKSELEAIAG